MTPEAHIALTARQLEVVAAYFGTTLEELCGPSRVSSVTFARHVAMYVLHRSGLYPVEISRLLGRHHSTVIMGVRRIKRELLYQDDTRRVMEELGRELREVR